MSAEMENPKQVWWRRWFVSPVVSQLTKGISPEKVAWTISLGLVLGIFPILGSTTFLCLFVGWMLGLNQPLLQAFNTAAYPLHLATILPFIRAGEFLHGADLMPFSIRELLSKFQADPLAFVIDFGLTAWHGVSAWLLLAPVAALGIKVAVFPLVRKMAAALAARKEVAA